MRIQPDIITQDPQALDAVRRDALFLVGGVFIRPSLITAVGIDEGQPEFHLADGASYTADPDNPADVGHLLARSLAAVTGSDILGDDGAGRLPLAPGYPLPDSGSW